jgi:hypothetical protein
MQQPQKHVSIPHPIQSQNIQDFIALPQLVTNSSNEIPPNQIQIPDQIPNTIVQTMQQTMAETMQQTMAETMESMKQSMQIMQQTMEIMQQSLQGIPRSIQNLETRPIQRSSNHSARLDSDFLIPLNDNTGNVPQSFPQTVGDLKALSSGEVDLLLQAYGQPLRGTFAQKKPCELYWSQNDLVNCW